MNVKISLGVDRLAEYRSLFEGKKVGLITNVTGVNQQFEETAILLAQIADLQVIFAPEHGVRGDGQAGENIVTYFDEYYEKNIISLYGNKRAPSQADIQDLDLIVYDIQDIGSRYYTYIYTMFLTLKVCQRNHKQFVVLDRPDIFGGNQVMGTIMPAEFYSFVGMLPLPNVYGMTVGELALFCNQELGIQAELKVIELKGWRRGMSYNETGLPWISPSPNIPTLQTAWFYVGTCLFEGTNLSEGRGTSHPFELIGAPWLNGTTLAVQLNQLKLPGVYFRPSFFTPTFSKYQGELCEGIQIHLTDSSVFNPLKVAYKCFELIQQLYPEQLKTDLPFEDSAYTFFTHLMGHKAEKPVDLSQTLTEFEEARTKYLLY